MWEPDQHEPKRFFSWRTDEQIQAFALTCFDIVDFHVVGLDDFRFQSLTLRAPSGDDQAYARRELILSDGHNVGEVVAITTRAVFVPRERAARLPAAGTHVAESVPVTRLPMIARAALVAILLAVVAGCGGDEVGVPSPEGLYNLPTDACTGVDFAPFAELYGTAGRRAGAQGGEPHGPVRPAVQRRDHRGRGAPVRRLGAGLPAPVQQPVRGAGGLPARCAVPDAHPVPDAGADRGRVRQPAAAAHAGRVPRPGEDVPLIRYEWTYGNTSVELVVGNILMTVDADWLGAGAPPAAGESAPPDPMLSLPQRVRDLIESVLKTLSG